MTRSTHERPLVAFTLLLQFAVGAFVAASALDLWSGPLDSHSQTALLGHAAFITIVATAAAGLSVSFAHLGTPVHAWRALANLRRSWLSREILFTLGFVILAAAFTGLRLMGMEAERPRAVVAAAAALCGVALIYSMSRVYRLRTMPAWDTRRTTLSFFSATGLMGSLAVGAAVALWGGGSLATHAGAFAAITAGGFVLELGLEAAGPADALRLARVVLLGLGAALTIWAMLGAGPPGPSLAAACAAVAAAQVVARVRFFRLSASRPL